MSDAFSTHTKRSRNDYLESTRSNYELSVSTHELGMSCMDRQKLGRRRSVFNTLTNVQPVAADQNHSGRCWLFAATSVMRNAMIKKMKLPCDFELSQNYLFFWDKYERCRYFLECIVSLFNDYQKINVDSDTHQEIISGFSTPYRSESVALSEDEKGKDENEDDSDSGDSSSSGDGSTEVTTKDKLQLAKWLRLRDHLFLKPLEDGGQWTMVQNVVAKYGVIPKDLYRESHHSSSTGKLNEVLCEQLQHWGLELFRALCEKSDYTDVRINYDLQYNFPQNFIVEKMDKVYHILCMTLGRAPLPTDELNWEYTDVERNAHSLDITPKSMYEDHVPIDLSEYCAVINDPRRPYQTQTRVLYMGNFSGDAKMVKYYNVSMDDMKAMAIESIKEDQPVWFGCDVGKFYSESTGMLDYEPYTREKVLGADPVVNGELDKCDRLHTFSSLLTHAMVLTGVHLDTKSTKKVGRVDGKPVVTVEEEETPVRWKVENSWGAMGPQAGYLTMKDSWFSEYVYEIVVPKKILDSVTEKDSDKFISTNSLMPWDPMGSLALV